MKEMQGTPSQSSALRGNRTETRSWATAMADVRPGLGWPEWVYCLLTPLDFAQLFCPSVTFILKVALTSTSEKSYIPPQSSGTSGHQPALCVLLHPTR